MFVLAENLLWPAKKGVKPQNGDFWATCSEAES